MSPSPRSLADARAAREAHHAAELRAPWTLVQASLLYAGLSLLPLVPGAERVLGTPLRITAPFGVATVAAMWAAFLVYRAAGAGSRAYAVADRAETTLFAHGPTALVGLGGAVASIWWLPYVALCFFEATSSGVKRDKGAILGSAPLTAALLLAARGHRIADAIAALGVGGLAMLLWLIGARATDRQLADEIEREALRAKVAELERERQKAAADEERRRIAMELHDGVGATLTAARLIAQLARRQGGAGDAFDALEETLKDGLTDLRLSLWSLDAADTSWPAITARLRRHAGDVCRAAGLGLDFQVDGAVEGSPSPVTTLAVVRIVQEALTNAVRHAHAQRVDIRLRLSPAQVEVTVVDDGGGAPIGAGHEGRGLGNIERRVRALGGTAEIARGPAGGTCVSATVPCAG